LGDWQPTNTSTWIRWSDRPCLLSGSSMLVRPGRSRPRENDECPAIVGRT
jgi:hypothetical protein